MDFVEAAENGYPLPWVMFEFFALLPLVVVFVHLFGLKVRLNNIVSYPDLHRCICWIVE